jgi:outer membrane protein OmpA-like peptidoglycan-associated protein
MFRVSVAAIALVAMAAPLNAVWNRTALLIDAPTADVLPVGAMAFSLSGTDRLLGGSTYGGYPNQGAEIDLNARYGVTKRLELALTAYTQKDYVLGLSYLLAGGPGKPSVAAGVHDIGWHAYVSPVGDGPTGKFPDEIYYPAGAAAEIASAFVVGSFPIQKFARVDMGLGRGRYVGFGPRSKLFNTDMIFTDDANHQYAVGLFGGAELNLGSHVKLVGEYTGRDVNAAIKTRFGPLLVNLALMKLESFTDTHPLDTGFQRVGLGVSYEVDRIFAGRRRIPPGPILKPVLGSLRVTVLDQATHAPIPDADITVTKSGVSEPITEPGVATNGAGEFAVDGIPSGSYLVTAEKQSYETRTMPVDAPAGQKTSLEILLQPSAAVAVPAQPAAGPVLHLVPIYFGWDSSNISDQSATTLKNHAALLGQHTDIRVTIVGSCDESGTPDYNLKLGLRRSLAAYDYLLSLGVAAGQLQYKSIGAIASLPGEPIRHWKNRRCEFITQAK